jgi:superfamily II DNA or RNA helicase
LKTSNETDAIEAAVWAVAEGHASADQLALLEADDRASCRVVDDLLAQTQVRLESVHGLKGPERAQVIADFAEELEGLRRVRVLLDGDDRPPSGRRAASRPEEREEGVRLQASWAEGEVVVWAAGPSEEPATNDELADRLEALGGPALGWRAHQGVPLDHGRRAEAVSIPVADALGWLVSVGASGDADGLGASVRWLGHVAVTAVRQVARGAVVPALEVTKRGERSVEMAVRWQAALMDNATLDKLATTMPGTVLVLAPSSVTSRVLVREVIGAVVHAVVAQAAGLLELPAPPPTVRTPADVAEAIITRLDGGAFTAPTNIGSNAADRLRIWAKPVLSASRPLLVVQLVAQGNGDAWFLSVLGPGPQRALVEVEQALAASKSTQPVADELARVERLLPVLQRAGALRRGQVYLSTDEAWEFMTVTAPMLQAAGFEVRVPALSRRKPKPALRLFTEPVGKRTVGARQLNNVRWSAVFDDIELTADEVIRLAADARPLVQSRGQWVELDRLDLQEAAAALADRATTTQLTGAAILRHAVGLEGSPLGQALLVDGSGWAADLLDKAASISREPADTPKGFAGQLRTYQSEALGWLGFLDAVELGGCLALDMGLGKTPTVLAHLARTAGEGTALVIAPAAVVGNWEAEAHKFTPDLRVVVHHGASRTSAAGLAAEVAEADILITTYGTAVRDVDALAELSWRHVILDEAQAIKNPASETSQQLRRIPARTRLALTGTPIENGLGDLWSILDYCNPDLVGSRATFSAQLAGEGEAALRALNGILVFRRTKAEPEVAAELPDKIDELDHCTMTREQIGLYQAVLDSLLPTVEGADREPKKGAVLAAITALKQICNHPAAYQDDGRPLAGRSGKLARLEELVEAVFAANERMLIFTHFAEWGKRLADHLTEVTGTPIACYHGGQTRTARDRLVREFQSGTGAGAMVLSLTAGGTGLNLTAANHVVLYDRWWNPAKEDQARDRAWRIGQTRTVVSHRLVCPGTIDERVEDIVEGKRRVADLVLPKSSSLDDLSTDQLRVALGLDTRSLLTEEDE